MAYYLYSSNYNRLVTVNYESLENLLKHHSQSSSCVCKLPEYYFQQAICVSPTSHMYEPCCGHVWCTELVLRKHCVQSQTWAIILW